MRIPIKHLQRSSFPVQWLQFYIKDINQLQDCLGALFLKLQYFVLLHYASITQIWTFLYWKDTKMKIFCSYWHDWNYIFVMLFTLFRMRGGRGRQKAPPPPPAPTSFSSVTSANIGISPQNMLTFSFNLFATLM